MINCYDILYTKMTPESEPGWYAIDEYGVLITGPCATQAECVAEARYKLTHHAELCNYNLQPALPV